MIIIWKFTTSLLLCLFVSLSISGTHLHLHQKRTPVLVLLWSLISNLANISQTIKYSWSFILRRVISLSINWEKGFLSLNNQSLSRKVNSLLPGLIQPGSTINSSNNCSEQFGSRGYTRQLVSGIDPECDSPWLKEPKVNRLKMKLNHKER